MGNEWKSGVKSLQRQLSNPVWVCGGQRGCARPAVCHFQGQWAHWSPGSCWSGLVSVWQVINRAEDWALMPLAALPCRITRLDTHLPSPCSMCVSAIVFYYPELLHPTQTNATYSEKINLFQLAFFSLSSCLWSAFFSSHPHNSFISFANISFAPISLTVVKYSVLYSPLCKLNLLGMKPVWESLKAIPAQPKHCKTVITALMKMNENKIKGVHIIRWSFSMKWCLKV